MVRFDGNAAQEGLSIIAESHDPRLTVADTMEEAAAEAVRLATDSMASDSKEGE